MNLVIMTIAAQAIIQVSSKPLHIYSPPQFLIIVQRLARQYDVFDAHIEALRRLVAMRGGLENLGKLISYPMNGYREGFSFALEPEIRTR